jgi:phage head maturation protease
LIQEASVTLSITTVLSYVRAGNVKACCFGKYILDSVMEKDAENKLVILAALRKKNRDQSERVE